MRVLFFSGGCYRGLCLAVAWFFTRSSMIVGLDQILVDIYVKVEDDAGVFKQYGLQPNTAILSNYTHQPLVEDLLHRSCVDQQNVRRTPGGPVCNAMCAAAWSAREYHGNNKPAIAMMGAIGHDTEGLFLQKALHEAGVNPVLDAVQGEQRGVNIWCALSTVTAGCVVPNQLPRTGVQISLVNSKDWTRVIDHRSATKMAISSGILDWNGRISRAIEVVSQQQHQTVKDWPFIIVVSDVYAQADPNSAEVIWEWCQGPSEHQGIKPLLVTILSCDWQTNTKPVQLLAQSSEFVFANLQEVLELSAWIDGDWKDNLCTNANDATNAITKVANWKAHGWLVVLISHSRGPSSVVIVNADLGMFRNITLSDIPEDFVDSIGMLESFMGGFLAHIWMTLSNKDLPDVDDDFDAIDILETIDIESAAEKGIATATACLRCAGCTFPAT